MTTSIHKSAARRNVEEEVDDELWGVSTDERTLAVAAQSVVKPKTTYIIHLLRRFIQVLV
jgi:hypothetical protein